VYRADVVTSGRITPTMPLPAAVAPVNWAIAEKVESNDVAVSVTAAAVGAGVGVAAGEGVALCCTPQPRSPSSLSQRETWNWIS